MDNNPNTTNPVVKNEGSVGPVIGTIIILAVILLGGLYFWSNRSVTDDLNNPENAASTSDETAAIETQSSSDDTNSLQYDLDNTNVDVTGDLNAS
jgi:hypothetical protein